MKLRTALGIAIGSLMVGMAIGTELAKPPSVRTWEGRIGGVVPYDLRFPTLERLRERYWNPDSDRVITKQPFGVGWTFNVGRVARLFGLA
ncbi:MAG: hypothetical protein J2P44_12795 [Candidatus Dormibacteraeota bacterium]|nr:hypothetical protein [Candidatus Dormibacteraeota bacterium]